jgi:hypothetical protein
LFIDFKILLFTTFDNIFVLICKLFQNLVKFWRFHGLLDGLREIQLSFGHLVLRDGNESRGTAATALVTQFEVIGLLLVNHINDFVGTDVTEFDCVDEMINL